MLYGKDLATRCGVGVQHCGWFSWFTSLAHFLCYHAVCVCAEAVLVCGLHVPDACAAVVHSGSQEQPPSLRRAVMARRSQLHEHCRTRKQQYRCVDLVWDAPTAY